MNKYFVSYWYHTFFRTGCGMSIVETKENMETEEGLLDVMRAIKEKHRFSKVVINNFKKLGEDDG